MAVRGVGYFDGRGQYFRTPDEATISDLAAVLGRVGEGDSLAPGIAKLLLLHRREIEHIFADHDNMVACAETQIAEPAVTSAGNVTHLQNAKLSKS